ncbi:TetR/AcrR family transcriptional regulator C-terminal domain-containing protein [Microbispora triticiradicis]|uniref:GntR family transcriptional regulator n=2 Tax=Microbispora TaxID=2005 RepID=A0ABY3M274_9ACTN|nr:MULTISPECIES: TetR/AcrR family transcriptional regulator C-terminal domain-containing protein [Microbispora]TLP57153.1 GntR family transcriptional regulator [Microbispora fusca]TYB64044.1 GntR family transcriptional regulator [Microbispora tritici]
MDGSGAGRYQEIAAELRRRIETGELRPGDRVPSTREIIRRWGVAMATATKVLTELRREGLVRAVPGVGTVVDTGVRTGSRPSPAVSPQGKAAGGGPLPAGSQGSAGSPRAAGGRGSAVPAREAGAEPGVPPRAAGAGEFSAGRPGAPVRSRRRGAPDGALTPARITSAAIAVADAEGLGAVSMRRVAAELGVATMSLYRHVADKDALVLRMMEEIFARMRLPGEPPRDWRGRIELAARLLWATFRRHPWLAPAMSVTRPQPIAAALPFTEWMLTALDGHGLDLETVFTAYITVFNHVRGTAINLEVEAEAEELTGMSVDEWMDAQEPAFKAIMAGRRLPMFESLSASGYDFDIDALFEFGLQRLLDGISMLLTDTP